MRYLRVPVSALLACLAAVPGPVCAADAQPVPVLSKLRIRVIEGDGAVHRASSHSAEKLTVQVTDADGNAVNGATVSFQLPERGPGGQFAGGLRTDVETSDERGLVSSETINWNQHTGTLQVKIMAQKGQALAGTLSSQYVTEFAAASAGAPVQTASLAPIAPKPSPPVEKTVAPVVKAVKPLPVPGEDFQPHRSYKRMMYILTTLAGVAATGLEVYSSMQKPSPLPKPLPAGIGTPVITLGAPK